MAIKVMAEHIAADPSMRRRFETEAQAVAAVSHPGIMAIYELGVVNDRPFAVMELLRMVEAKAGGAVFFGIEPAFARMRGLPRFEGILSRIGAPGPLAASALHQTST